MIDGTMVKNLKVIPDERGRLIECLRNDDDLFIQFGRLAAEFERITRKIGNGEFHSPVNDVSEALITICIIHIDLIAD